MLSVALPASSKLFATRTAAAGLRLVDVGLGSDNLKGNMVSFLARSPEIRRAVFGGAFLIAGGASYGF